MSTSPGVGLAHAIRTQYGLEVRGIVPVRSAYKIVTKNGDFCLKRAGETSRRKLAFLHGLSTHLWDNEFDRIPRFIATTDGKLHGRWEELPFFLTTWLDAREASLDRPRHLRAAARGLAELHRASAGFRITPSCAEWNQLGGWSAEFEAGLGELWSWRSEAASHAAPTDLDRFVLGHFGLLERRCEEALFQLHRLDYQRLLAEAGRHGVYSHNSLYYQNILVYRKGTAGFVDLNKSLLDIRARDVAMFINRRLKSVEWRTGAALAILDAYQEVAPLSAADLAAVYCRLLYPERLFKRMRAHYGPKRKPAAAVYERVMNVARQEEKHSRFLAVFPSVVGKAYGLTF